MTGRPLPQRPSERACEPLEQRPEPTPAGTQRRLRALANRRWWPRAITDATGIPASVIATAIGAARPPATGLDEKVAAAYDQLWDQQPPAVTNLEHALAARARRRAETHGWPPPMAWDDDLIDQSDAGPAPNWRPRPNQVSRHPADVAEDAAWVREHGGYRTASNALVALRLGITGDALQQATTRASRQSEVNAS